ncbi:Elongator complex protein 1 [Geodia barretti]|uniref:Elongator complex protein 1 n=1 Tax=Geodia barretti TaxID=519541 RepID=A0AA35W5J4_GEOBA|nr:Elongator complex protein 1 [Geodia barretti]
MENFEKAGDWQMTFALSAQLGHDRGQRSQLARKMAASLKSQRNYSAAATVLLQYAEDVEEAMVTLLEGGLWDEALRIPLFSLSLPPSLSSGASARQKRSNRNSLQTSTIRESPESHVTPSLPLHRLDTTLHQTAAGPRTETKETRSHSRGDVCCGREGRGLVF